MTETLVLGAGGRIGRMLRGVWPGQGIWHARQGGDLAWDMLADPVPGQLHPDVVLNLAGVTDARAPMEHNVALAQAAWQAAAAIGARYVFLMSSAAVYGVAQRVWREDDALAPVSAYGEAKARMENAARAWQAAGGPGLTILRLGNVAGADALLGRAQPGVPVQLDPVASQRGPLRSYIGPRSLAQVLARLADLAATGTTLPPVLNIAAADVAMGDLLDAAGLDWFYGDENPAVVPQVSLDTTRLNALCPLPAVAGLPATMVAEWHGCVA
ncbi:NAD-dependent epimerase/dehydratase family protein [Fertoebacter nigrum]|uniref:NAD-dependent epimerase/dehydratase family protein n=1 Tax=Fertoeibacter niger TaxID=2656921 RepID=A0A8X8H0N1_9RHOB|nr:NAD-dependent epimerase/dehydratase family protein [Fertoeibacter niger]NUB45388.1 NAD-dependent epimerase/dehydratase family protein [Fertoeibacter niger]